MVQPVAGGEPALPVPDIDAEAFNAFVAAGWEERAGTYGFLSPMTRRVGGTVLAAAMVSSGCELFDVGVSHIMFEAAVPDADTLWHGVIDSAVRVRPLVAGQTLEVQAAIRVRFEVLASVHGRADGTLAIPVAVQVTRGRRP